MEQDGIGAVSSFDDDSSLGSKLELIFGRKGTKEVVAPGGEFDAERVEVVALGEIERFDEDALDVTDETFGAGFELSLDGADLGTDRGWHLAFGAEHSAAQQVQMQVVNGHSCRIAHIEGETVAAFPNTLDAGHIFAEHEEAGEHFGVVPFEFARAIDVDTGNDETVDRSARVDITNRDGVFVFRDELDRDFAAHHPAEEAVLHLHGAIVVRAWFCVEPAVARVLEELQTVYSSGMAEREVSVLSHFWSPLCAVGSHGPNGPNAQICVSVFGASIVPERPRLLVVLSKTNYTTELVHASRTLSVTVLSEAQSGLLEPLGLRSGRDGPKLEGLAYELTQASDPVFTGGAGWVQGGVLDSFDLGDSTGFLVAVRTTVSESVAPMSWQTAKGMVGEEFLARWAEKSAREQEAARAAMTWRE